MRWIFVLLIPVLLTLSSTKPIQDQGSSQYCLFAVAAYLVDGDMWRIEQQYFRDGHPVWPNSTTPYNTEVLQTATKLYGAKFIATQDYQTAETWVREGRRVASSGQGHAVVLIGLSGNKFTYVDSLNPGTHTRTIATQQAWSDGWYWRVQ